MNILPVIASVCFGALLFGSVFAVSLGSGWAEQAAARWVSDLAIIEPKAFNPGSKLFAVSVVGADHNQGGCVVNENGEISYYSHTSMGDKGSTGGKPHSKETLIQLRAMLGSLPPSSSTQPPDDRKLLIHSFLSSEPQVFGYDLANVPEVVLEFMRLSECHIAAFSLGIPPDGEWQAHRHDDGSMAVLKKANQLVTCARYQPLRIWDIKTHTLIREVSFPVPHVDAARNLAVSPDERFIALTNSRCMIMDVSSWQIVARIEEIRVGSTSHGYSSPMFVPDGKQLFLRTGAPVTGFYEVETWNSVAPPPGLAEHLIKFVPLSSKDQYMALDRDGQLSFTSRTGSKVTIRERQVQDFCCAVMPSEKQIAVAVGTGNAHARHDYQILLIDANTGHPICELRPFEQACEDTKVIELFWSPDSRYVLAALESGDVAIWNAATGRHRGTLQGRRSDPNSVVLSPDQTTLYQLRGDGVLQYWKVNSVLDKVAAFENSLGAQK